MPAFGFALAVLAAACNSGATLFEAAAGRVQHHPRRARRVWPPYLLGLFLDLVGWLCTLLALRALPLFAVQAVVAEQIVITVLVGHRIFGTALRRIDVAAALATALGLALVAAGASTRRGTPVPPWLLALTAVAIAAAAIALLPRWSRRAPWLLGTLLAGGCFTVAAVAARALQTALTEPIHIFEVATRPALWLIVGFGAIGTVLYLRALPRGNAGAVLATLSVTEVMLPGAAGIALLGDRARAGWVLPSMLGLAVAVVGTAILAQSPAHPALPSPRPRRRQDQPSRGQSPADSAAGRAGGPGWAGPHGTPGCSGNR